MELEKTVADAQLLWKSFKNWNDNFWKKKKIRIMVGGEGMKKMHPKLETWTLAQSAGF